MADLLLDDEPLDGAYPVHLTVRPHRTAHTVDACDGDALFDRIRILCQEWGGAGAPIIPLDKARHIRADYAQILPGSAIDDVAGLRYRDLERDPLPPVDPPGDERHRIFGTQLAFSLLDYRNQDEYLTLDAPELDRSDPWFGIYAVCLGLLAPEPDARRLKESDLLPELTFEDFVNVDRPKVIGSLDDLVARMSSRQTWSPRQLSTFDLGHGAEGDGSLRSEPSVLPNPRFAVRDGHSNVVVVCTPDNVEDLCLLWNLRAAYGDRHVLPIGVPAGELTAKALLELTSHPRVARFGFATRRAYVTSTSVPAEGFRDALSPAGSYAAVPPRDVLTFGPPPGWPRQEVVMWRDGRATIVPVPAHQRDSQILPRPFSRLLRAEVDIQVPDRPFPAGDDVRVAGINGGFFAGRLARSITFGDSNNVEVLWPSRALALRSVGARRGVELAASDAGKAASLVIRGLSSTFDLTMLAHEPLLTLLESMAARTGASWAKRVVRDRNLPDLNPTEEVAPVVDDLPERSFDAFREALGRSAPAARVWLRWAETSGLVVKGFPLECSRCGAKQWTPVSAFAPPIICRGCAREMTTPFDDREQVAFRWRISERTRKLYEVDALGHLMLMRYFGLIFGAGPRSSLIGMYPGIDVTPSGGTQRVGEADLLTLFRNGDLVPAEVKRSFGGVTDTEVDRLEKLARLISAPWSCLAVSRYALEGAGDYPERAHRHVDEVPFRLALTWDHLLELHPLWTMGSDPFAWAPLNETDRAKREAEFVKWIISWSERTSATWLEEGMLQSPESRPSQ